MQPPRSPASSPAIDIAALIDRSPVSSFQRWLLLIVGLTVVIDGFDVQAMGFVGPAIVKDFGIAKSALGPVFGAGLLGMLVGSLCFSVLADKIGRRPVLLGATLFFSACMLCTATATSVLELQVLRFVTGLGLGAIMPNAMALAGEYSPRARRVTLMMWVSCGFTVGAVLGGLVSAALIAAFGWRSVFWAGGLAPLVLALLMFLRMPESLQFLVLRGRRLDRVAASLRRIAPGLVVDERTSYVVPERRTKGAPVAELFRHGRAKSTVLLWIVNFMNLLNLYFLSNWLPTIAAGAGLSTTNAVLVGTALQVGGVVGTVFMGPIIDRVGFYRVLVPVFALGAVTIVLIGQPGLGLAALFAVVAVTGFCIIGGQPAVNALAATTYATTERSTGVGWSLGIGRFGSIVGPVLGGVLIELHWSTAEIFAVVSVPVVLSAVMLFWMSRAARPAMPPDVAQGVRA